MFRVVLDVLVCLLNTIAEPHQREEVTVDFLFQLLVLLLCVFLYFVFGN